MQDLVTQSIDLPYGGISPEQEAALVRHLTQGVTDIPAELLPVRQYTPGIAELDARGRRISEILENETVVLREQILHDRQLTTERRCGVNAAHFLALVDAGDEEGLRACGLDTSNVWLDDVARAIVKGWPVEIEAFTPEAKTFQFPGQWGAFDFHLPNKEHTTGADIAALLRKVTAVAGNMRIITFAQDYLGYGGRIYYPNWPRVRDAFVASLGRFLAERKIVLPTDAPGQDFLVVRESEQMKKTELLKERLVQSGNGKLVDGGQRFRPSMWLADVLDPPAREADALLEGIWLEGPYGPSQAAIDAASFINPLDNSMNERFIHMVIRDVRDREEQAHAHALMLAGEVVPRELYHRLLYDAENLSPAMIVYGIGKLLQRHVNEYRRSLYRYSDWPEADPYKYARQHYGKLGDEDREIIRAATQLFDNLDFEPGGFKKALDIGTGSNWYSVMLSRPYVQGAMTVREFSPSYRAFLEALVNGTIDLEFKEMWKQFEAFMVEHGGSAYKQALEQTLQNAEVEAGSIYDLSENDELDYLSAFFVLESIVDTKLPFWQLFRIVGRALRRKDPEDPKDRGGVFVATFMVGSQGWEFGDDTFFPAVDVTSEQIRQACNDAGLECVLVSVGNDGKTVKVREGYAGMAFMIAWHKTKIPGGGRA